MNNVITNFPISVYGKMDKFNDTISRGRCRVFYKGLNRNGTYITDSFAEKLIASAPYTPVKGIYEFDDYTDHGKERSEGRIYGLIPADPNFAWEKFTDDSGIEREYACFDVLYYTALYKEAGEIDGKSESMELYKPSLKGEWQTMNGKRVYVFTDGCFLGLQALGDDVEPCFEGASFYSCESNIIALLEKYEKRKDIFSLESEGGNATMENRINFKISDAEKHDKLFNLLNPNFNAEGEWIVDYAICQVYDEYAVAISYETGKYERVYYVKNDETDTVEITNREEVFVVEITAEEKEALENMRGESTYVAIAESYKAMAEKIEVSTASLNEMTAAIEEYTQKVTEFSTRIEELENLNTENGMKIVEFETNFATLSTERDNANEALNQLTERFTALEAERDALATYKKEIELANKQAVIANYVDCLDETIIEKYLNNIDSYTVQDLDKELTYEQKKANPNLFTKQEGAPAPVYIPKDNLADRSISDILAKYEKK